MRSGGIAQSFLGILVHFLHTPVGYGLSMCLAGQRPSYQSAIICSEVRLSYAGTMPPLWQCDMHDSTKPP